MFSYVVCVGLHVTSYVKAKGRYCVFIKYHISLLFLNELFFFATSNKQIKKKHFVHNIQNKVAVQKVLKAVCWKFFSLFLSWIAGDWEAYSHNYRHYVSQCPVHLVGHWLPNFPHKACIMHMGWLVDGQRFIHFPSKSLWVEWGSNCNRLSSNWSSLPLYHAAYLSEHQLIMFY